MNLFLAIFGIIVSLNVFSAAHDEGEQTQSGAKRQRIERNIPTLQELCLKNFIGSRYTVTTVEDKPLTSREQIKSIQFSLDTNTPAQDYEDLKKLTAGHFPNLQELDWGCSTRAEYTPHFFDGHTLSWIATNWPKLQSLKIEGSFFIDERETAFLSDLENLQELSLEGHMTDSPLEALAKGRAPLRSLTLVDVNWDRNPTCAGYTNLLRAKPTLQRLNIGYIVASFQETTDLFEAIMQLPSIRNIYLKAIFHGFITKTDSGISTNLKPITTLVDFALQDTSPVQRLEIRVCNSDSQDNDQFALYGALCYFYEDNGGHRESIPGGSRLKFHKYRGHELFKEVLIDFSY